MPEGLRHPTHEDRYRKYASRECVGARKPTETRRGKVVERLGEGQSPDRIPGRLQPKDPG